MIEWLYRFSDLYIILFCIAVSLVAMFVVHAVCHKVVADKVPREGFKFAEAVHNSLISLCTLVLAFSLVQAIGNFRLVNTEVATEAAQINNLDRLLLRFNSPEANDVRQHLLAYAKSIVEDDWPALINAGSSEKTTALFKPISKGIIAIAPKNDRQVSLYSAALGLATESLVARFFIHIDQRRTTKLGRVRAEPVLHPVKTGQIRARLSRSNNIINWNSILCMRQGYRMSKRA